MHSDVNVVVLPVDALTSLIRDAVKQGVQDALAEAAKSKDSHLLTRQQLAKALAVSLPTVDRMVSAGMPRASTRPPRFDLLQCRAWLTSRKDEE